MLPNWTDNSPSPSPRQKYCRTKDFPSFLSFFLSFFYFLFYFFSFFFLSFLFLFFLFFFSFYIFFLLHLIWDHFTNNYHIIFFYKEILCNFFSYSICKGISLLIDRRPPAENFTKEFPLILIWVHFTKDSHGIFFLQGNPL